VVVGTSREAADDLARRVTATGGTFGFQHRASLLQLAARVAAAELARLGAAPTTALGADALAARVAFALPNTWLVAVNGAACEKDRVLQEGDRLDCFEPVAGG